MTRRIVLLSLAIIIASAMAVAQGGFVHTDGKKIVDGQGRKLFLKGTSLGNWMVQEGYMFKLDKGPQSAREIEEFAAESIGPAEAEKFWKEYRQRYVTRDDIQFIAKSGYNSVRVPFHYKFFNGDDAEGFKLVDQLVKWAKEANLVLILDMHCAPGGQTGANIDDSYGYPWLYESEASQQELIDVWKRIARHYRDEPTIMGYDLMNEPIPNFPEIEKYNDRLEPLLKRVTAAIREVDQNHVIVLEAAQWDTNFKVFGPPFDKNVVYEFHRYWMPPTQDKIADVVEFRDKYKVPIWLGESGENDNGWIKDFRVLLEKNDIGWAFWPYKKMDSIRGPVSFAKPVNWDKMVAFGASDRKTGNVKETLKDHPSVEDARAAFADLLEKVQFKNCTVNKGYMEALGLKY